MSVMNGFGWDVHCNGRVVGGGRYDTWEDAMRIASRQAKDHINTGPVSIFIEQVFSDTNAEDRQSPPETDSSTQTPKDTDRESDHRRSGVSSDRSSGDALSI
jgi:hypothetical protein